MIRYLSLQKSIVFLISAIVGLLGVIQYQSIQNAEFEENNEIRDIRILIETNREMKNKITNLQEILESLQDKETIREKALEKTYKAQVFAGEIFDYNEAVEILMEGDITIDNLVDINHILWNAGAENISINDINLTYNNVGFDQAGEQILIGGNPISAPYIFEVFGNTARLSHILDPKKETLKKFITDKSKITVSLKKL